MSWPVAVVLIVMIVAAAKVLNARYRAQDDHGMGIDERESESRLRQERDQAEQEITQLKERVKVLERIATDPARRTAEEIEKLRDD